MNRCMCVMERGECFMSMKLKPRLSSNADLFWPFGEERSAFEAFGGGGGCMWPPRSYSCSFCGREFKSAQALGGHMNVHRRDRARLKQQSLSSSSSIDQTTTLDEHDQKQQQDLVQEDSRKSKREISNDVLESNNYVKTDLSVGLLSSSSSSCKRAKKDVSSMLGLVINGVSKINGHHEELDLELRLGADPPKVN